MSFSKEITLQYIKLSNLFSNGEPFNSYNFVVAGLVGTDSYSNLSEPIVFPTLWSFGMGRDKLHRSDGAVAALEAASADYVNYRFTAVLHAAPHSGATSFGKSGFFDWQLGFNFKYTSRAKMYGDDDTGDIFKGLLTTDEKSDDWMQCSTGPGAPGTAVDNFYTNSWIDSPHEMIFYQAEIVGAVVEKTYLGPDYETDVRRLEAAARGSEDLANASVQVLLSTKYAGAQGAAYYVDSAGASVRPPPSDRAEIRGEQARIPNFDPRAVPIFEGTGEDLTLYEVVLTYNYDLHTNVRDDLKERFKTSENINSQRDAYVDALVDGFVSRVAVTEEVPRGFITRKQAAPRSLRENYTTFTQDENMSETQATTSTTDTPTAGMGSSGGSTY